MKSVNYIVAGGRQIPCAAPVFQWTQHGMTFPGLKPRRRTDLVTLHWTAAENPEDAMFRNLRRSGLSVHFFVNALGGIWQYNDADALAAHASGMNDRAVGIEIQNRANAVADDGKVRRALAKEVIHGREFVYTLFTAAQVHATLALCAALCEAYALPWKVPMEPVTRRISADSLKADGSKQPVMRVIPRKLTEPEFKAFRGMVGHFHWTEKQKRDCGLALLQAVAAFEPRQAQGLGHPAE